MLWWEGKEKVASSMIEEKCLMYKGQKTLKLSTSLNKRYRTRLVEAMQHRGANMSTLSSIGSVGDSAGFAFSLPPVERHQVQEQVRYLSG